MSTSVDERPVRVVDAPLIEPGASLGLITVAKRRYLLKLLVEREVSSRYANSLLGLFWSYMNPGTQFFIYWVVIGGIMGASARTPSYPIHVFAGLVVVHFYNETFGAGTRSIVGNKALIKKMAMPKELFPVAAMLVSLYHLVPAVVIMVIASILLGWTPSMAALAAFVLAVAIIAVLGTGLSLLFSVANVFFDDFGSAVGIINQLVRFGVPMMYPFSFVRDHLHQHAWIYLLNPIANAVVLMQRAFWVPTVSHAEAVRAGLKPPNPMGELPDHLMWNGLITLIASLVLLFIGQLVFRRLENKIPERLT